MSARVATASLVTASALLSLVPIVASDLEPPIIWDEMPWDTIHCSDFPEEVTDLFHEFPEPSDPTLIVAVHTYCFRPGLNAGDDHRGTDCPSHAFNQLVYKWNVAYSAQIDEAGSGLAEADVIADFDGAGNAWDAETAANIYDPSAAGGRGRDAGRLNDINQIGWKRLAGGTIAQTTTWYQQANGNAVESDGAYNTRFAWSTNGEANKMDAQAIMTHEIGHTFGLGHPANVAANECLTMYAFADFGQTHQRTPGDGDILGIEAIYGA